MGIVILKQLLSNTKGIIEQFGHVPTDKHEMTVETNKGKTLSGTFTTTGIQATSCEILSHLLSAYTAMLINFLPHPFKVILDPTRCLL